MHWLWSPVSQKVRFAESGRKANAKTYRTAVLFLIYLTAKYSTPVWCCSAHTRLVDNALNDALQTVAGCLSPTPTKYLPVLSGIQLPELFYKERQFH